MTKDQVRSTEEAISTERALDLALEALEYIENNYMSLPKSGSEAITAIKQARSAPVQEPFGYVWFTKHMEHRFTRMKPHPDIGAMNIKPVYTAPPGQEPVAYTTGHCKEKAQPGGCQLHNLHCGYPACDRKAVTTQPAAPVQEPEYVYTCNGCNALYREDSVSCDCTVNGLMEFTRHILAPDTTPPAAQRQWVGLTDEEIGALDYSGTRAEFVKAIEAKLRSKNNG